MPCSNSSSGSHTSEHAFTAAEMEAAFDAMKPAIEALSVEECPPITVDIDLAAATVLASIPRIAAHEPQLKVLPGIMDAVSKLRTYALAVMHVQMQIRATDKQGPSPSPKELDELLAVRELMLGDLMPLVRRHAISDDFIEELNASGGYRNTANDVFLLATIAEKNWSVISGRTAITTASIETARKAATDMLSALVAREGRTRSVDPGGERLRAVALMMSAYDEARRGIWFVHWGKEATIDAIAPSLFKARGRSKPKDEPTTDEPTHVGPAITDPDKDPVAPVIDPDKPAPTEGPGVRPFA